MPPPTPATPAAAPAAPTTPASAQAGAHAPASPPADAPPKPEPRKYKVGDREIADDSEDFQRFLTAGADLDRQTRSLKEGFGKIGERERLLAAREAKLKDAATLRATLRELGHDPDRLTEAWALEMYQASQLSPAEVAARKLAEDKAAFEREKEAHAGQLHEQQVEAGARAFAAMIEEKLPPLLEARGLKGDGLALRDVADLLEAWTQDGSSITDAHLERAVRVAGERLDSRLRTRAAACTSADERKALLGPELYAQVKADLYADWKARQGAKAPATPAPKEPEQPREANGRYAPVQRREVPQGLDHVRGAVFVT